MTISAPAMDREYNVKVSASVLVKTATQPFALVITGPGYVVESGMTWQRLCRARKSGGCSARAFVIT